MEKKYVNSNLQWTNEANINFKNREALKGYFFNRSLLNVDKGPRDAVMKISISTEKHYHQRAYVVGCMIIIYFLLAMSFVLILLQNFAISFIVEINYILGLKEVMCESLCMCVSYDTDHFSVKIGT
jgi:hypothetical protein